jgi:hypothetical protein
MAPAVLWKNLMSPGPNSEPSFAARDYDPRDPPRFGEGVRVEGIDLSAAPPAEAASETAETEATETIATPESPAGQDGAASSEAAAAFDRNNLAALLTGSSDAWRVTPPMSTKASGADASVSVPEALPDGADVGIGPARSEQWRGQLHLALMLVVILLAALLLYLGFGGPASQPTPSAPPAPSPTVQPTLVPTAPGTNG